METENETRTEISVMRLIASIHAARSNVRRGEVLAIVSAIKGLRRVKSLPAGYVDGIQDELLQFLGQPLQARPTTSVYLAFHGLEDRASFVKAGVAENVKSRMRELYTGNPLPRLWTYAVALPSRELAYRVESAIHDQLRHTRTSGEWFHVHGLSQEAAHSFASSLSEVATDIAKEHLYFALAEV